MHPNQRSVAHWRGYRPWLEKLEDRSQPGTLFAEAVGWSLLGDNFANLDRTDAKEPPASRRIVVPQSPPDSAPGLARSVASPAVSVRQENPGPTGPPASVAPREQQALLTAASVVATPPPGGGGPGVAKFDGAWFSLAPMPSRRQEVASAFLNNEVYVLAGFNPNGQSTNVVEVYSLETNSWRRLANLPFANNHSAAAVAGGTLYTFGGVSNRVLAYDPKSDQWLERAPMIYQHGNTPAVAVIDDWIYVAGGTGPGMLGNEFEVYDPAADKWYELPPMNVPRNHTAGGNLYGYFVVAGGRPGAVASTAFEAFDWETFSWVQLPDMPTGRSGIAGAAIFGCFYVFGGEMPGVFEEVELFDPAAFAWRSATSMTTPRHGIFAAVYENLVFLAGGATQQGLGATDTHEVFVVGA